MADFKECGKDITRCHICSETFTVPKLLPCLHSFCETCLQTYISKNVFKDGTTINKEEEGKLIGVSCPLCRAFIRKPEDTDVKDWVNILPTNFIFQALIVKNNAEKGSQNCDVCDREIESESENKSESASYWCASCCDSLCETCERQHRKFKSTSSHKVISITNPTATSSFQYTAEMTCKTHGKEYEYYCRDHSLICCMTCVVLKHRQCEHVITAEEAAEAKRKCNDENSLTASLLDLTEKCKDMMKNREQNADKLTEKLENARQVVRESYDSLIRNLTEAKSTTLEDIDECGKQFMPRIHEEKVDMKCKVDGLNNTLEFLHVTSKYASPVQYLCTTEKLTEQKIAIKNLLEKRIDIIETIDIHFTPNDTLSEVLKTNDTLGSISVFRTKTGVEENTKRKDTSFSAQLASATMANVKPEKVIGSSTDAVKAQQGKWKEKKSSTETVSVEPSLVKEFKFLGGIYGAAILDDGRMLISRCNSKILALIDMEGNTLSSLSLDYYTEGIKMISSTKGAVVVFNKCLQFFKVNKNDIVRGESLNVPVRYDFAVHRDLFYIGGDKKIMVYNSARRHVRDIAVPNTVGYIAVRDDTCLCYTVVYGRMLYFIKMDGTPVYTYLHDELQRTTGVAVDNSGFIYVCDWESRAVHRLSHDGRLQGIIFDNLSSVPWCICLNSQSDKAVIGCGLKVLLYHL